MENNNQNMYGQQNKTDNNQNIYNQSVNNPNMYNQNMGGQNGYNPAAFTPAPKNPSFVTWLVLSILQMICCNQITGIITLVFTLLADSDFKQGLMREYESKMKGAKIATIVGVIMGIAIYVFVFIYYVLILGIAFAGEL